MTVKWNRLAAYLLAAAMLASCAGCGAGPASAEEGTKGPVTAVQEETEEAVYEASDAMDVYAAALDDICDVLYNGMEDGRGYPYAPTGVIEMSRWMEREDLLNLLGWTAMDISGDGVPELLVGETSAQDQYSDTGLVYGGFTIADGEPTAFLDGWGRNRYQWMGGGRFYNAGSSGAMYSAIGTFQISPDGGELVCEDFYFTDVRQPLTADDGVGELAVYHNTTGSWEVSDSEETDLTEEAFWAMAETYESQCQQLDLTPFDQYPYDGEIREAEGGSLVRVDFFADAADRYENYEDVSAEDMGPDEKVLFQPETTVWEFNVLALEVQDMDEQGNVVYGVSVVYEQPELSVPLAVPMSFPGDIPTNGFSYVDGQGETHRFTIGVSGFDGSLIVAPFE